jgi:hypothetical protein
MEAWQHQIARGIPREFSKTIARSLVARFGLAQFAPSKKNEGKERRKALLYCLRRFLRNAGALQRSSSVAR